MNKMVGAAEFKAKCLKLIDEMQKDRIPITITKRGKPVAEVRPSGESKAVPPTFGMAGSEGYRFDDPFTPAVSEDEIDCAAPGTWDKYL